MFDPSDWSPYKSYFAFKSFGRCYKLGDEVYTLSDNDDVYVLAARDEKEGVILIANTSSEPAVIRLDVIGASPGNAQVIKTDDVFYYTVFDNNIRDNTLSVNGHSCTEIRVDL